MQKSSNTARRNAQDFLRGKNRDNARGFDSTIAARTVVEKERRHRAIARFYASGAPWSLAVQRVREIDRFFAHRYGNGDSKYLLPDDDGGKDDALIICRAFAACPVNYAEIRMAWLSLHAPWADARMRKTASRATALRWKADTLAEKLGLYQVVRRQLNIRTIGAIDLPKGERDRMARERRRMRKEAMRRAEGKLTRAEYLERNALSRTEPWVALGISRPTYYRRLRQVRPPYRSEATYRDPNLSHTVTTRAAGAAVSMAACRSIGGCAPAALRARCARAA
jgi:hypothetical protein